MSQPPACALSRTAALNITRERDRRGWSQRYLAAAAGITQPMVAHLETGRRNLTFPVLERIAGALELDPAELLRERVTS